MDVLPLGDDPQVRLEINPAVVQCLHKRTPAAAGGIHIEKFVVVKTHFQHGVRIQDRDAQVTVRHDVFLKLKEDASRYHFIDSDPAILPPTDFTQGVLKCVDSRAISTTSPKLMTSS